MPKATSLWRWPRAQDRIMADHAGFDPLEVYLYRGKGSIPRNVVRVEVHRSVKFIPRELFQHCKQLQSVLLHDGLLKIGRDAFSGCSSLRRFRCPSTVTEIGEGAFFGCLSLMTVELPEGLEEIEGETFWGCASLEGLQIPASVARIGVEALYGCKNLASVGICEGPRMIGNYAFRFCISLESLHVPSSVDEIGEGAFDGCRKLSSVQLQEHLPIMKRFAFRGCPLESLRFARLSERTEALGMDERTTSVFESRLNEIANAMAEGRHAECEKSLGRAHEFLTYLELKGAAPALELVLWKAKIRGEGEEGARGDIVDGEGARLSREDCRVKCGAGIVLAEVLKSFTYSASWPRLDD